MMDYYARIVQGEYPAVILMLGVAIPGINDHNPVKETCRRFEMSLELKLALGISHAAARKPLQSGKEDRALHKETEQANKGSRVAEFGKNDAQRSSDMGMERSGC